MKNWIGTPALFCGLVLFTLTGCGGGGGGGGSESTNPAAVTPTSLATSVETAFDLVEGSNPDSALSSFNALLSKSSDESEKKQIYNGLGWAFLKKSDPTNARSQFEKGVSIAATVDVSSEIRLGYASSLLATGDLSGALTQLEIIRGGNDDFIYFPVHSLNINNGDSHALLALVYALTGNKSGASVQKGKANSLDASQSGTVTDQIVGGLTSLGF